jgi:hypothetical protein
LENIPNNKVQSKYPLILLGSHLGKISKQIITSKQLAAYLLEPSFMRAEVQEAQKDRPTGLGYTGITISLINHKLLLKRL